MKKLRFMAFVMPVLAAGLFITPVAYGQDGETHAPDPGGDGGNVIAPLGQLGVDIPQVSINKENHRLDILRGGVASIMTGTQASDGGITLSGHPGFLTSLRTTLEGDNTKNFSYSGGFIINTWQNSSSKKIHSPFLSIYTIEPNVPIRFDVGGGKTIMQLFQNQVLIGPNLPFEGDGGIIPYSGLGYVLGVRGATVAESVTCKALGNWGDFVFNDDYRLTPLAEVEQYVKTNKHLPGVPSAKELEEKGVDVYEMLKVQMEKIEELTLHSIQQQKRIEQQQHQIDVLIKKKRN